MKLPIGEALREVRDWIGLSQRAAAKQIGCSHVHLNNVENEKCSTTVEMLDKIYAAWKVDVYLVACLRCRRIPKYEWKRK